MGNIKVQANNQEHLKYDKLRCPKLKIQHPTIGKQTYMHREGVQ